MRRHPGAPWPDVADAPDPGQAAFALTPGRAAEPDEVPPPRPVRSAAGAPQPVRLGVGLQQIVTRRFERALRVDEGIPCLDETDRDPVLQASDAEAVRPRHGVAPLVRAGSRR